MTMSRWAEVSRISAGMVDRGLSVALNPGRSAYSLPLGWRYLALDQGTVMSPGVSFNGALIETPGTGAVHQ